MARGGLYKSDVQKARATLLAQGVNPSLDALRVALGNTGSKSTIHRFLKELEAEEGLGVGAKVAVSDALQDLVGRLAARLHEEAEALIAEAQQRFDARLQEHSTAVERGHQEAATLSAQLQRTETAFQAETAEHGITRRALAEGTVTIGQLQERAAGLVTRLTEHEAHARSLEEKHQHAREALEHYRTSVKDQRDQEQRRHEQQLQELQVALRQANAALNTKNHELLQLNRDNGQWLERHNRLERELVQGRQAADAQQEEVESLRVTAAEHRALQVRWTQDVQTLEVLRGEATSARAELAVERERREQAEVESLRACVRLETLDQLLAQLQSDRAGGAAPAAAVSAGERPPP